MGEEGCLTNEKFYNLEVSNNLQLNGKMIYDFQEIEINGSDIDLNKPLIFIKPTGPINLVFRNGLKGQMIILINTTAHIVTLLKRDGSNQDYKVNGGGADSNTLDPNNCLKLIWNDNYWFEI